jgi:hypothetical protein
MASPLKMTAGERADILAAGKDPAKVECLNSCLGPAYPEMGATVAKFRRLAAKAGSIAAMPRSERIAYANAIEAAIHAKNNAWWKSGPALEGPNRDVGAKIRSEHKAALSRAAAAERAARKPAVWEAMYEAAMAAKRKAAEAPCVTAPSRMPAVEAAAIVMAASKSAKVVKLGRAGVDWRAAGLKAAETRKRNLAAKAVARIAA